jgi:hypothetical protein
VPKRTNLFQEVVAIIYGHLAGEAAKEESAMLRNRLTGYDREVDVVLRVTAAGHETVIAIEAASRSRPASVDWVEQMIGKHQNLPTDKVVLVAEAGFSKQARALARAEKMVPLTPQDVAEADLADEVVSALPSLWPKTVSLAPDGARVWVRRPDGSEVWFKAPADLDLVVEDGTTDFDLLTFFKNSFMANWRRIAEQIDLASITEDTVSDFVLQIGPPVTIGVEGEPHHLFARWMEGDSPELHRVEKVMLHGKASIHVSEIKLERKQLGEINVKYAFAQGSLGGLPALLVVSESDHGEMVTVRLGDAAPNTGPST